MSSCGGIHSYGLLDLIAGFVYLAVAYVMLWVATWVYVASGFLGILGFFLPCPCEGILGFWSKDLCLRRILVEFPVRKMYYVRGFVERNLVFSEYAGGGLSVESIGVRSCGREIVEIRGDGEGCSGAVVRNSGRKEGGFDVKGKLIELRKQRYGLRRRRKGGLGYGKFRPSNLGSQDACVSSSCDNIEKVCAVAKTPESFDPVGVMEYHLLDSEKASVAENLGKNTGDSYELSEAFDGGKVLSGGDTSSLENLFINGLNNLCNEDETNRRIRILEQALTEEKAGSAALYLELEEERVAAATAADEAMAMIFRLQEEKAMIEMEVRQSQRMIEEKVAYDEEEMDILKEILIRRERESFFLENELRTYKQALPSDESGEDLSRHTAEFLRRRPSLIHPDEDSSYLMMPSNKKGENSVTQHLQSSDDEVEAVYDVHVVDDTIGHGNGRKEELEWENDNSCVDERQKPDGEVEWLREMLRIVQRGKEKLRLSGEVRDRRSTTRVNLVEDIRAQLQEIERMMRPAAC